MFETMALEIEQLLAKVRSSIIHVKHRIIGSYTVPNPCLFNPLMNDFYEELFPNLLGLFLVVKSHLRSY